MRLLWIATKPPTPPVDGGRLVALLTLEALTAAGVETTLVAPAPPGASPGAAEELRTVLGPGGHATFVPCRPRPKALAALVSLAGGSPLSIGRHAIPELAAEVDRRLRSGRFDAVHAEQLQALPQAEPAFTAGVPVVLRAQNVESDLWRASAERHRWSSPWFAREARRLARYEARAVARVAVTVALTDADAERLRALSGGRGRVVTVPPPFPAQLPPAERRLPGEPSLVLLGSGGWPPNRDANRWFVHDIWPLVRARLPRARLHLFAEDRDQPRSPPGGVDLHPPPPESRHAFAPGSVLVVPLRIASGIRMKILEAWARGIPVVASPAAADGLGAEDGRELLLADGTEEWVEAAARVRDEAGLMDSLVAGGRRALAERHAATTVTTALAGLYGHPSGGS